VLFEEVVGGEGLGEIYRFLGVDADFQATGLDARVNSADWAVPELSPGDEARLAAHFAKANERLSRRLGRSLTLWHKRGGDLHQ
jgi:hypothetical protein